MLAMEPTKGTVDNAAMIPRIHCPFPLAPGANVELPAEAAHHVARVLRLSEGDRVHLFDGSGGWWGASLVGGGKALRARLEAFYDEERESPLAVTLVQCLPSGDKMDFVIQKAVELGVARIQPVVAKRSVVRLAADRMERRLAHWRAVAIAACEQCGRNRLPDVSAILDLPQYLGGPRQQNETRWACLPSTAEVACVRLRDAAPPEGPVAILIGPEAGFEPGELKAIATAGFRPLTLGPRVLRTETAGPAALAALMSRWGDW